MVVDLFSADWVSSTIRWTLTLGTAGCQVPAVGMGQMRPREDPGASREGKGLLSEMEWVHAVVMDFLFCER